VGSVSALSAPSVRGSLNEITSTIVGAAIKIHRALVLKPDTTSVTSKADLRGPPLQGRLKPDATYITTKADLEVRLYRVRLTLGPGLIESAYLPCLAWELQAR
jgi:hypothetical protein